MRRRLMGLTEEQEKVLKEHDDKKALTEQQKNKLKCGLDVEISNDFDDDDIDEPWDMDFNKKKEDQKKQDIQKKEVPL